MRWVLVAPANRFRGFVYCRMYVRMRRARFGTDVKMPRASRSRSILANQSSTWLSQEEYVGVKCSRTWGCSIQEGPHGLRLVRRQVVEDDVDLSRLPRTRDHVPQEVHEGGAGVAVGRSVRGLPPSVC